MKKLLLLLLLVITGCTHSVQGLYEIGLKYCGPTADKTFVISENPLTITVECEDGRVINLDKLDTN